MLLPFTTVAGPAAKLAIRVLTFVAAWAGDGATSSGSITVTAVNRANKNQRRCDAPWRLETFKYSPNKAAASRLLLAR